MYNRNIEIMCNWSSYIMWLNRLMWLYTRYILNVPNLINWLLSHSISYNKYINFKPDVRTTSSLQQRFFFTISNTLLPKKDVKDVLSKLFIHYCIEKYIIILSNGLRPGSQNIPEYCKIPVQIELRLETIWFKKSIPLFNMYLNVFRICFAVKKCSKKFSAQDIS